MRDLLIRARKGKNKKGSEGERERKWGGAKKGK